MKIIRTIMMYICILAKAAAVSQSSPQPPPSSSTSSSWFTVPPDYKYPAWHVALVALLTTSAAVGAVATAFLARRHCRSAASAAATVKRDKSCGNGPRADKESGSRSFKATLMIVLSITKKDLQGFRP